MFDFVGSPVAVRPDLRYAYINAWAHFARPGPTLTGTQRVATLAALRESSASFDWTRAGIDAALADLVSNLYGKPTTVDGAMVRRAADAAGDATTVEAIAITAMLAAIDGTHRALAADLEPLPAPASGEPTGNIAAGLKRRRTHIPVPPGPIPVVLDLLPDEGAAFQALFGPQYMTGWEMALDVYARDPGLNRAQMELVSSRTSIHNECFY